MISMPARFNYGSIGREVADRLLLVHPDIVAALGADQFFAVVDAVVEVFDDREITRRDDLVVKDNKLKSDVRLALFALSKIEEILG